MTRAAFSWTRSLVLLLPLVLACSGSNQKDAEVPTGEGSGSDAPADTEGGGTSDAPPPRKKPPSDSGSSGGGGLNDSQKEMMEIVLKRGSKKAEQCSESVPDGKGGEGEVQVLFDGQKGRITDVTVGAPWAGTSMESCVKRSFVGEIVMPFDGDPLEVPYTIKIPARKTPIAADPNKPGKKP